MAAASELFLRSVQLRHLRCLVAVAQSVISRARQSG